MRSFPGNRRSAFTLIEVVVGLALMATVVVASLLSFTAHRKQRRFADAKMAAVRVADEILVQLSGLPEGIPASGRGPIPGQPNWFWQTRVIGVASPAQVPLRVVQFEVMEVSVENGTRPLVTAQLVESLKP